MSPSVKEEKCEQDEMTRAKLAKFSSMEEMDFELDKCDGYRKFMRQKELVDPRKDIVFQHFEINYHQSKLSEAIKNLYDDQLFEEIAPTIILYGVTQDDKSIACHVHGFERHFYLTVPATFNKAHCELAKNVINEALTMQNFKPSELIDVKDNKFVTSIELVKKQTVYGHHFGKEKTMIKIFVALPSVVYKICRMIGFNDRSEHESSNSIAIPQCSNWRFESFESFPSFVLRYMIDKNVFGCSWMRLPAKKFVVRENEGNHETLCQIEVDIWHDDIISYEPHGEWSSFSNYRILCFDIEGVGETNAFPKPEDMTIIQIGNYFADRNHPEGFHKVIFTLKSCAPIAGAEVICFEDERELLLKWAEMVREMDPELITGYNVQNFDMPYLLKRAEHLGISCEFSQLGRLVGTHSKVRTSTLSSKQMGSRENQIVNVEGRNMFDILLIIIREQKLRSYKLNSVAYHFLKQQKEDVPYTQIPILQNGDEHSRKKIAIYCLKDCQLPLRIMNKLMLLINSFEMSRVTGVPLSFLIFRGQSIKFESQFLRESLMRGLVIPDRKPRQPDEYEGAIVIEPDRGYYNKPIATLDFASLYPSIIIAHNLCHSTLLTKADIRDNNLTEADFTVAPNGECFLKEHIKVGLLPKILEKLLSKRKAAKRDMANEDDPFKKSVLNGRQLSLKLSANSAYGVTGSSLSKVSCVNVSQSVTAFGRNMIEKTKSSVQEHYSKKNGFSTDCKVIYGDTDSVMCDFGLGSLEETIKRGQEAAEVISKVFKKPIKLEFEKVYLPMLLMNKKRYAGLLYTKPNKHDYLDCKGMETVRRDNCPFVGTVLNTCLNKLMIERDPDGAIEFCKRMISDLLLNKVDISRLVISKELTKTEKQYANKQPHTELAAKMAKRNPGSAPKLGERVPYVIVRNEGKKLYEKAENPTYALENDIPLDTDYYLTNQLSKPLIRLFEPVFGSEKEAESKLLKGDHTRTKKVITPKTGALSSFMKTTASCMKCKCSIKSQDQAVCKNCERYLPSLYLEKLKSVKDNQYKFNQLWTQCQRCLGSFYDEVVCDNSECQIFYHRQKAKIDLIASQKELQKFSSIKTEKNDN